MNLHDVQPRQKTFGELAEEILRQPLGPWQQRWLDQAFQPRLRPRMVPVREPLRWAGWDVGADPQPTFRAMEEPLAIIERLHGQWLVFRRANIQPRDLTDAALTISRQEWIVIRQYLPWFEFEQHFGHQEEGTPPHFRGYPLVIQ